MSGLVELLAESRTVVLAVAGLVWLAAAAVYLRRELAPGRDPARLTGWLVGLGAAAMGLAAVYPYMGDYETYLENWATLLAGGDPWTVGPGYPYGPLYNLGAWLMAVWDRLPRLVFCAAWVGLAVWYWRWCLAAAERRPAAAAVVGFLLLNPYFWIETPVHAHFDILVGIICLAAVHLTRQERLWAAGVVLGGGFLLKFMPVVLLPFLMLRREGWKLVVGCLLTIVAGYGLAQAIWGAKVYGAFTFLAGHSPSGISLFYWLNGSGTARWIGGDLPDLAGWSRPLLLGGLGFAWLTVWRRRVEPVAAALVALLVPLAFFTVSHIQHVMPVFVLLPYYWLTRPEVMAGDRARRRAVVVWLVWFSLLGIWLHFSKAGEVAAWNLVLLPVVVVRALLPAELLAHLYLIWVLMRPAPGDRAAGA